MSSSRRLPDNAPRLLMLSLLLVMSAFAGAQTQRSGAIEAYRRGIELFESDFILEAIRSFQEAAAINPNYADAYRETARGFYYLDEYDEAEAYIRQALALAPNDNRNRTLYGRILVTMGDIEAAELMFRRVLEDEPFNAGARIGLGELSLATGDVISAGDYFQNSLSLDPGDRRVLLALAFIYQERGQTSAARDYILRAVEADSQNPWVHYYASDFYFSRGQYDLARYHALTAMELRDDFYPAMEMLSRIMVEEGEYDQALGLLSPAGLQPHARSIADVLHPGGGRISERRRGFGDPQPRAGASGEPRR
jgi:tetratricopeptide (TPR) repeat protein